MSFLSPGVLPRVPGYIRQSAASAVRSAAAAIFEVPDGCDLACVIGASADQVPRLVPEGAPAPAVAAAGAVLVGEPHRLSVDGLLCGGECDLAVVGEELL